MESIKNFSEMTSVLAAKGERKPLYVVSGSDDSTLHAVRRAIEEGFATACFVGDVAEIRAKGVLSGLDAFVSYVEAPSHEAAASEAVRRVRQSAGGILVKGLLHTATLLRAVLHKEEGLLPPGATLTHVAALELPSYPRLLFLTDAAVIPYPTDEQRATQVAYLSRLLHAMGNRCPRIALNHCAETVSEKFPHTLGYAAIIAKAETGVWGECVVDGPLDFRTAVDAATLRVKGIRSKLEGEADAIVVPDIETGNALYKALTFFSNARIAGRLMGTTHPVVLPSRGDDAEAKYHSLALASF